MTDRDDLDALLSLADRPGPLPPGFEDQLLGELHASLAEGPIDHGLDDEREALATLDELPLVRSRPQRPRRWARPMLAAAAAVFVAVGLAALGGARDTNVGELPPAVERPPDSVPVLPEPEAACERFVATTPSRDTLMELVADRPPIATAALADMVTALDVVLLDAEAAEADEDTLRTLALARSRFNQTRLLLDDDNIEEARNSLGSANSELGALGAGFEGCRSY